MIWVAPINSPMKLLKVCTSFKPEGNRWYTCTLSVERSFLHIFVLVTAASSPMQCITKNLIIFCYAFNKDIYVLVHYYTPCQTNIMSVHIKAKASSYPSSLVLYHFAERCEPATCAWWACLWIGSDLSAFVQSDNYYTLVTDHETKMKMTRLVSPLHN